jgi:hypothetical protein
VRSDKLAGVRKGFRRWLGTVIALVVVAFVIPYVVLSSLDPGTAVYGFWSFFALVVVALISWGVKDWRDPE